MKKGSTQSRLATHRSAFKIVTAYAAFSLLWITFSDQILLALVNDTNILTTLQTIKGLVFISVTALIIYLLLYREISEVKRAEKALREHQEKYRLLATITGQIIYDQILPGNRARWSGATLELAGCREDELGDITIEDWQAMIHPDERDEIIRQFAEALERTEPYKLEYRLQRKDGGFVMVEDSGNFLFDKEGAPCRILGSIKDISERKQLEENIRHSQKMEAIGTLAGGIAHDFNNILGVIIGYADLARDEAAAGSSIRDSLDQLMEASFRARDLVKQILAFSRQATPEPILFQPAVIVKEALKMLRPTLPATIDIEQYIDAGAGPILADPTQFNQVLLNLCTNAFHAMEAGGGTLTLSLAEVDLPHVGLSLDHQGERRRFVRLSVADTGTGIPEEIREKVFSPYFTTKETGKGTGMGLSIVHGIVQSCGGAVSLESEVDRGTVVHVDLPASSDRKPDSTFRLESVPPGNESILFVDDEKVLTEMAAVMLGRLGYQVTTCTSAHEALRLFEKERERFDLVITDQTMPELIGSELARRVLALRPDIPVILCTGYSTALTEEEAARIGIRRFIYKPISKKDIAVIIRSVLDGEPRASN